MKFVKDEPFLLEEKSNDEDVCTWYFNQENVLELYKGRLTKKKLEKRKRCFTKVFVVDDFFFDFSMDGMKQILHVGDWGVVVNKGFIR